MLNRAKTPDLSYHPRRSVEPQMKRMRHRYASQRRVTALSKRKMMTRNFIECLGSNEELALNMTYIAGSTILRVENGLSRDYLG